MARLLAVLLGVLLVGAPLVLFAWHEISEALLGRVHTGRLGVAFLLLAVLSGVLSRFGRFLLRLEDGNA